MTIQVPPFEPPYNEDEDSVRVRLDASADATIEKREGDWYQTLTQPGVIEKTRQWDSLNDVIMMTSVLYALGEYLDRLAFLHRITRNAATYATGEVTFTGTDGVIIPVGTTVNAPTTSDEQPTVSFVTTEEGTIAGGEVAIPVIASETGSLWNISASAITTLEDSISGVTDVTNDASFSNGAEIEDDESLRQRVLEKIQTPQAAGSAGDYERWALEEASIGAATVTPQFNGNNNAVLVTLLDRDNNPVSQTIMDDFQRRMSGDIVLTDPVTGPSGAEGAAGNVPVGTHYYKVTFVDAHLGETKGSPASTGVVVATSAKQVGLTSIPVGPTGTSKRRVYRSTSADGPFRLLSNGEIADNVATTLTDNDSAATLAAGDVMPSTNNTTNHTGVAPVGAWVFIDTPTTVPIDIVATVTYEDGYSFDGASGTTALQTEIETYLRAYIDSLEPGEDVIYNHVRAQFFKVEGVHDVTALTVEGGSINVPISVSEVADYTTPTIS